MVGTGLSARFGILIKGGGEAIEMAYRLDTIAFDKTVTLTYGKLKVVSAKNFNKDIKNESVEEKLRTIILQIVGVVESASGHPLARAVTQYVSKRLSKVETNYVTLESVSEVPGKGLKAVIKVNDPLESELLPIKTSNLTYNVFIGNEKWLRKNNCIYPINDKSMTISAIKNWKKWVFGSTCWIITRFQFIQWLYSFTNRNR